MSKQACPSCGCKDIEYNDAAGEAVCTSCGRILEENTIVSSIEFSENTSGKSQHAPTRSRLLYLSRDRFAQADRAL